MKRSYHILLFLLLSIIACNKKVNDPIKDFSKSQTKQISPCKRIDLEPLLIYQPWYLLAHQGYYYVFDHQQKHLINRIDYEGDKHLYGVNKGNGPEDLLMALRLFNYQNNVLIYDFAKEKIYKIIEDEVQRNISISEYLNISDMGGFKRTPSSILLTKYGIATSASRSSSSWIEFRSYKGEILSQEPFPVFENTKRLTDLGKCSMFGGPLMISHPNEDKMVCACHDAGVISVMRYNSTEGLQSEWQHKYYVPKLKEFGKGNDTYYATISTSKIAFRGIACDDKYIFLLYSGKTWRDKGIIGIAPHILVYDWGGNPVRHFELEQELYSMGYDRERKLIYGIGYDPEGCIFEYDLNKYL